MKFNIYRHTKSKARADWLGGTQPSKVATIEADDAYSAAEKFAMTLYKKKGTIWKDRILEFNDRRRTADLWLRKFTPSGRYQGETHFYVWPAP